MFCGDWIATAGPVVSIEKYTVDEFVFPTVSLA